MICKEPIQLNALLKVFYRFETSNMLQELKVSMNIDAGADKSMPVDTLQFNISVIFLKLEINCFSEVYVWSLNGMHVLPCQLELGVVEVFWKYLHIYLLLFEE